MKKNAWTTIGVVAIVCFCVWQVVKGLQERDLLNKSHVFGEGAIAYCKSGGRNHAASIIIRGYLFLNGKEIKLSNIVSYRKINMQECRSYFVGRRFPVAYVPDNPFIAIFLITPEDFQRFNLPYPDSLQWVLKYVSE